MRKMQEYVVKGKPVFIGLEDSKRKWVLCVRSEGIVVQQTSMPAEYENLRSYLRNKYPECRVKLVYEAGFRGFGLHDRLVADGFECIVTPPNKVTQAKDHRVKNDKVDSRRLARVLEKDDVVSCFVPDRELREDRQISRTLVSIQRDITRVKNRINRMLDIHELSEQVTETQWNLAKLTELHNVTTSAPVRQSLDIYLAELQHVSDTRKQLLRALRTLSKKQRYAQVFACFHSAPGVGWFTAIRLVLEWGEDIAGRFAKGDKLASYIGLTGSEFSTADTERRGPITRQGTKHVRSWIIECAWSAYRKDPVLLSKFQRVRQATRSKKKAIVAVARKLVVRLWHLAVFKESYTIGLLEEQPA